MCAACISHVGLKRTSLALNKIKKFNLGVWEQKKRGIKRIKRNDFKYLKEFEKVKKLCIKFFCLDERMQLPRASSEIFLLSFLIFIFGQNSLLFLTSIFAHYFAWWHCTRIDSLFLIFCVCVSHIRANKIASDLLSYKNNLQIDFFRVCSVPRYIYFISYAVRYEGCFDFLPIFFTLFSSLRDSESSRFSVMIYWSLARQALQWDFY